MSDIFDILIVGSGAAGLSAAVYAARTGLNYAVIEKNYFGIGQIAETDKVDNYLGLYGENGFELGMKFREHAEKLGTKFISGEVKNITKSGGIFELLLDNNEILKSKKVIYAGGTAHKKLGIEGEERFTGKGVSYCAVCDGAFYKNKTVAIIGGGNTALNEAVYLSNLAEKVYLVHRRDAFRANMHLQKKIASVSNIETILNAIPVEISGNQKVEKLILKNNISDEIKTIDIDGIFIAIGMTPQTECIKGLNVTDENGYIIAGEDCVTSCKGFFAAGDVRTKKLRQIITAAADGANAVNAANAQS